MGTADLINSVGLLFDVVGAFLIFRFGVATIIDTGGRDIVVGGQIGNEEAAKIYRHKRLSKIGLGLLLFGFILQFISNVVFVPSYWS